MKPWHEFIKDVLEEGGSIHAEPYYKKATWVWVTIGPPDTRRVFAGARESFEENIMTLQEEYLKSKHTEFMSRDDD